MSAAKKAPADVRCAWWQIAVCTIAAVGIGVCIGWYFCGGVPA